VVNANDNPKRAKQLKSGDNLEVEFEDGNVNTKVI